MPERDELVFQQARDSAQRFEYFLLGISLALCAYEGKTLVPQRLGINAYTIEVIAVGLIIASVIVGFWRVQMMIATSSLNHELLSLQRQRLRLMKGDVTYDEPTGTPLNEWQMNYGISGLGRECENISKHLHDVRKKSARFYKWRVWLLVSGFVVLAGSKVIAPYL